MPRGVAPAGAPPNAGDRFEQCLETARRLYERVYGYAAADQEDPLLADIADKLASRRWGEWLAARRLWDRAQRVVGTTAASKRFHEVFYKALSPEESSRQSARREAFRRAMGLLRARLEGTDLERTVTGWSDEGAAGTGLGHLVHEDETGQLWEVPLPGADPLLAGERGVRLVRVVDVQPGPDKACPVHWLFADPEAETARQAVAWTFGVNPDHYWPTVEA